MRGYGRDYDQGRNWVERAGDTVRGWFGGGRDYDRDFGWDGGSARGMHRDWDRGLSRGGYRMNNWNNQHATRDAPGVLAARADGECSERTGAEKLSTRDHPVASRPCYWTITLPAAPIATLWYRYVPAARNWRVALPPGAISGMFPPATFVVSSNVMSIGAADWFCQVTVPSFATYTTGASNAVFPSRSFTVLAHG